MKNLNCAHSSALKVYAHTDAEAKALLPQVSKYIEMVTLMKLPFWIFTENSKPIGIVTTGKEPMQLLAQIGTPVAVIDLIQKNLNSTVLEEFASQSLKLALEKEAQQVTIEFASDEKDAINSFLKVDFRVLAETFTMTLQLDHSFDPSQDFQFAHAEKDEMQRWVTSARKFLAGSADVVMERILEQLTGFPKSILEMYYSLEKFYFVNRDEHEVGILNFSPKAGRISNIGVDPSKRGQGIGRQTMMFGLKQLMANRCSQAKLRVHVDNKPALNLYRSLGFKVAERRVFLIWEKEKPRKRTSSRPG